MSELNEEKRTEDDIEFNINDIIENEVGLVNPATAEKIENCLCEIFVQKIFQLATRILI